MSTDITRQLPNDEYQAAVNSNIPSVSNPFATIADISSGLIPAFTPTLNGTNIVEVTQESDFGTPVGTNIFLTANTTYFVRGVVTITTRLVCIAEGVEIKGFDRNQDELIWAGPAGEALISPANVNFGLESLKFSSTVPGNSILAAYNISAGAFNQGRTKVLTILNCQFRGTYDVMDIIGYDLVDINNTLFFYIKATNFGLRFEDTSKIQLSSCELIRWFDEASVTLPNNTPANFATVSMIELKANNIASFGAVNINGCIVHPQQTQNGIDINTASTTGFGTISSNAFINVGLTTGKVFLPEIPVALLPDYSQTATYNFDIFANQGILNSTSGVVSTLSSNATATSLTGAAYSDINTGASAITQAAVRFTTATDGTVTYNGTKQIYCSIHASLTLDSGGNDDTYTVGIFKDSGGVPTLLPGSEIEVEFDNSGSLSLNVATVAINYGTLFNNGDSLNMQIKSTGVSASITATDYQLVIRE